MPQQQHTSEFSLPSRLLSKQEKLILAAYQLRARSSVDEIARLTGLRKHVVRYTMNKLIADEIAAPGPLIDFRPLGWVYAALFFSLRDSMGLEFKQIVSRLRKLKHVSYISCFAADPQFEVAFFAPSLADIQSQSEKIAGLFGLAEKNLVIRLSGALTGRKYLAGPQIVPAPVLVSAARSTTNIDRLDAKILQGLMTNSDASWATLASRLSCPLSTFRQRVQALEEKRVLLCHRFMLNPARMGMLDFKVLVRTTATEPGFRDTFESFADQHKNTVFRHTCIGPWDFELDIEVEIIAEVALMVQTLRQRFPTQLGSLVVLPRFYSATTDPGLVDLSSSFMHTGTV